MFLYFYQIFFIFLIKGLIWFISRDKCSIKIIDYCTFGITMKGVSGYPVFNIYVQFSIMISLFLTPWISTIGGINPPYLVFNA